MRLFSVDTFNFQVKRNAYIILCRINNCATRLRPMRGEPHSRDSHRSPGLFRPCRTVLGGVHLDIGHLDAFLLGIDVTEDVVGQVEDDLLAPYAEGLQRPFGLPLAFRGLGGSPIALPDAGQGLEVLNIQRVTRSGKPDDGLRLAGEHAPVGVGVAARLPDGHAECVARLHHGRRSTGALARAFVADGEGYFVILWLEVLPFFFSFAARVVHAGEQGYRHADRGASKVISYHSPYSFAYKDTL